MLFCSQPWEAGCINSIKELKESIHSTYTRYLYSVRGLRCYESDKIITLDPREQSNTSKVEYTMLSIVDSQSFYVEVCEKLDKRYIESANQVLTALFKCTMFLL